ncbi:kinase [Croceibacterium ferulae]|uniref:kinase n=1 Tax=Croceibacterium ferulae TaxID=1854641 RepID=UPI000EAB9352|nr:kinase [Croceibacterium ferulae]
MTGSLDRVDAAVSGWLSGRTEPLILGLCGAQGSGKSTLAEGLRDRMTGRGVRTAILSLDDLYLDGAARAALAARIHPLLRTRGVPLTHDVARGIRVIDHVRAGRPVTLPRFDKARDEPAADTAPVDGIDLLLFEGWCVGATPQAEAALVEPINPLEREADGDGTWRRAVNAALRTDYAALFGRIDRLVLLAAPGFEVVAGWRTEQEQTLRRGIEAAGGDTSGLMNAAAIARFVQHYERLTRHILHEMPARADLVLPLDGARRLRA